MRNFDKTVELIVCEFNHWLKMCDIANENYYDTGYFGARSIICDNVVEKIRKEDITTIDELYDYLYGDLNKNQGYKKELMEENKIESEKIQGCIDEDLFLLHMIKQGPI